MPRLWRLVPNRRPGVPAPGDGRVGAPVEQNYYVLPSAVGDSQLDERSEIIFREQYNKGIKAVNEKNWKQAVHYLAIAAAIHPNNEQLREHLRAARDEKRRQEAQS